MRPRCLAVPLLSLTCLMLAQAEPTTQPAKIADFLRFVDKGTTGSRLETADVVYRNADGVTVRLMSAVHIAEKSYYRDLSETFAKRDAVLYEMVKPKEVKVPAPGEKSGSGVSELQRMLKDTLGLSFQLDEIDYSKPNFIHADMDAETFERMQEERGETFPQLMLKALMDAMSKPQPQATPQDEDKQLDDLIHLLTRPDMERQIKLFLARNMTDIENQAMGLDGPNGSVIVTERNKAAIAKLKETLKDGKKDVAIFYGAAHMPDFSKRLSEMGFEPVETQWRMAWDLTIRDDQPSAMEQALRELLKALGEDN